MGSFIPLLILGVSSDGPDGQLYLPTSLEDVRETFGWYTDELHLVNSQEASVGLSSPVWGNEFLIYKKVGANLFPDPLYQPTITNSSTGVIFGTVGASGLYLFRYVTEP